MSVWYAFCSSNGRPTVQGEKKMLRKAIRKLCGSTRRYGKAEEGSAAVEFAMVGIPFFYMLFAIFETGLVMFTEYTLQASVQEASRLVKTGQAQKAGMSDAQFKSKVCETAGIIIDCMGQATVYVNAMPNFSALNAATPSMMAVGPSGTQGFTPGLPSQATAIVVTYDWDFVLPFMNVFSNLPGGQKRRLIGFTIFRNEPYS
jgi:Flp pilus assembly protein TadG